MISKKTFDSVNRNILFEILQKNGLKGNLFIAINAIYAEVKGRVKTNVGITDSFNCPIGLRQGCNLSPILFSMFINELYSLLHDQGTRGIQLFPSITEIFLLMFADDIALVSDTVVGLQKQLNILCQFCQTYKISVNITKSKILVFKRGGRLAASEKWYYDNSLIEVVTGFTYVGVYFTNRMSLHKMAEAMSVKGKKVLNGILSSFSNFSYVHYKTFLKVFDMKVCPVLLYGSELWGLQKITCYEQLQVHACKRFLNVKVNSCNDAILGDTGRLPLYINANKRCIKYWLRLLKLPSNRLVRLSYEMLLYFDDIGHTNWVTYVRKHLYLNGFGYVWNNQYVENSNAFLTIYTQRITDQFKQSWSTSCCSNSKLSHYVNYKKDLKVEPYIFNIDVNKFRSCLASFRSSSHSLMIEKGRHFGIPREFRTCFYCENCIEDEFHFVMTCPVYSEVRMKYIPNVYLTNANEESFYSLMSSSDRQIIRNIAMYIFYAFKERDRHLEIFV